MPSDDRRYEPDQTLLPPPSLRDWLPEDHLSFFLSDAVDVMNQIEETIGESSQKALADAGYRSESNFQSLEGRDIEGFVVFGREKKGQSKAPNASDEASVRMAKTMQTARGRDQYRKRNCLGEPPLAWIKSVVGFRQFSLRGIDEVSGEWDLARFAMNRKPIHKKTVWV